MKKLKLKVSPNVDGRPSRSPLNVKTTRCQECLDFIADNSDVKPEHIVDLLVGGQVKHYIRCWDIFAHD